MKTVVEKVRFKGMADSASQHEVVHKMSKKIAQLTKVIFHLNTKNDESDVHLRAVIAAHEQEIGDVVRSANTKVTEAYSCFEKIRGELDSGGGRKALMEKFETEKREALAELSQVKKAYAAKEREISFQWSERIENVSGELEELKSRLLKKHQDSKELMESERKKHGEEVAKIREEAKKDIAKAALGSNADKEAFEKKVKEIEEVRRNSEAHLQKKLHEETLKLTAQMDQLHALCDEKDALLTGLKNELEGFKAQAAETLKLAESEIKDLEQKIENLEQKSSEALTRAAKAEEALLAQKAENKDLNLSLQQRERDLVGGKAELERLEANLRAKENDLQRLQNESSSSCATMSEQMDRMRDSFEVEKGRWDTERKKLDAERRGMEDKVELEYTVQFQIR